MDEAGFSFDDLLEQHRGLKQRHDRDYALVRLAPDDPPDKGEELERLLERLAEFCREDLRDVDIVTRRGRTDLTILMPETTLARAAVATDRLLKKFSETAHGNSNGARIPTLSAGVSVGMEEDSSAGAILERAEQALRQAREEGGGCLRISEGSS